MMKLSDGRVTTLVKQSNLPYDSYITTCVDKYMKQIISLVPSHAAR